MNNNSKNLKDVIWHSYSRCSTPKQSESTKAQIGQSERVCEKYGWSLSDRSFEDFGVSGGNFKNMKTGELGMFFDAVDNGEIETPCGLILESLQRFSRSDGLDVAYKFREYIRKGVYIHFVHRDFTYELDDLRGDSYYNLVNILNEAISNERQRATHIANVKRGIDAKKRKLMSGELKVYTSKCPAWIDHVFVANDDGTAKQEYKVNEKKAEIVRRIFKDRISGIGTRQIANNLNKDLIPSLSNTDVPWTINIVGNILRSRRPCGFMEMFTMENIENDDGTLTQKKVRQLDSNNIPMEVKIYPSVISEETYQQARLEMDKNNGLARRNKTIQNTFSRLCFCGYCKKGLNVSDNKELKLSIAGKEFAMHRKNSGNRKENGDHRVEIIYFKCSNPNCKRKMMHEYYVQELLFKFLNEVNINALFGQTDDKELNKLEMELNEVKTNLKKAENKRDKTYSMIMDDEDDEFLIKKYSDIKDSIFNIRKEMKLIENKVHKEAELQQNVKKDWNRVLDLINSEDEGQTNRMRLNKLLRDKIEKIIIFSEGIPIGKIKYNKETYSMENDVTKNQLSIRVHFKGDVVRLLNYDIKSKSAVCLDADSKDLKRRITFKLDKRKRQNPPKQLNPILLNKKFLQDMESMTIRACATKWNLNKDFVNKARNGKFDHLMK